MQKLISFNISNSFFYRESNISNRGILERDFDCFTSKSVHTFTSCPKNFISCKKCGNLVGKCEHYAKHFISSSEKQ